MAPGVLSYPARDPLNQSHDIGGFMLPAHGELYTRWIQFGALSPMFRTHGSRAPDNIKSTWFYDQNVMCCVRFLPAT
jgi:alpha-glucosidase (family GH31 glycosyl hydrolase)